MKVLLNHDAGSSKILMISRIENANSCLELLHLALRRRALKEQHGELRAWRMQPCHWIGHIDTRRLFLAVLAPLGSCLFSAVLPEQARQSQGFL